MKNSRGLKIIWIDITNSPHVLILKPIIEILKNKRHKVVVTARDFAQTIPLLDRFNIEYTKIGSHSGRSITRKSLGLFNRTASLIKFTKKNKYKFDLALSHGSNDLAVTSFILGIPHVTMFDYEYASVSHHINFRLSKKVMCPDIINRKVLARYSRKDKLDQYEGLKEEYYLYGWKPDESVLKQLKIDTSIPIVVIRTPPDLALYHRFENKLFYKVIERLNNLNVCAVALPRSGEQGASLRAQRFNNIIIPDDAIDAQSLIYYADMVISAGGTMNREAVTLGTPVYTLFPGRLGTVDIDLMEKGKMFKLESPERLVVKKKKRTNNKLNFRNPEILVQKILLASK